MGITKQQTAANREAIVAAADGLFRERGVDAVGLNELMGAAGLTRGGFYNHFASKDALVDTVLAKAMADGAGNLERAITAAQARGSDPLAERVDWYLSPEHRADIEHGCPNASFAGDARRLDPVACDHYAQGLAANLDRLTQTVDASGLSEGERRARAIALFSEMIGGLLLSRAVVDADPDLADEILDSTRADLHNRIDTAPIDDVS
ncbi:MAG: TetR family regulatory protein [Amycolatopsis sp.]|uniref:TetR/AcrR family transcriptional regulator n=1 Tax=Amycolatopsis sp. TaxID=37632 RepID=UPI00262A1D4B|nr:TetR/AcrR family transcriptional regulator [Amycolatopsis sp.]MCU1681947.1 TetR family regulatory protein [Amycolatopsis sp.]